MFAGPRAHQRVLHLVLLLMLTLAAALARVQLQLATAGPRLAAALPVKPLEAPATSPQGSGTPRRGRVGSTTWARAVRTSDSAKEVIGWSSVAIQHRFLIFEVVGSSERCDDIRERDVAAC